MPCMLFSFLVPVYNAEKYLKRCVESLLVQQGADFEIILLDDGSPDGSPAICDSYQAAFPGIIRAIHKENEGPFLTRRRGFREARGEWFICVDSDDYAAPNLLETVVAAIATNDGCDMVMFNYRYEDAAGAFSPSRLKIPDGTVFSGAEKQRLYELRLTTTLVNNMWLRAVHRDIVDFDTDYSGCGIRSMCDDALQVLTLYTNTKKTVFIDQPLYFYQKGDNSITSRITLANWQAIHRSFVLEQPYVELWDVPAEVNKKRCTKQMENICNYVRWLYGPGRESVKMSFPEAVRAMKDGSMFQQCLEQYDKKYASSRYSAISIPVIATAVDLEWYNFLKCWFRLEKHLRRK